MRATRIQALMPVVQSLSSHFPSARQGWGILTLRLVLAGFLLVDASAALDAARAGQTTSYAFTVLAVLVVVAAAACVALGLLTSITLAIVVVIELAMLSRGAWVPADVILAPQPWQARVCHAAMALGVALIGPGAYSLDARLFGRREVYFPPRKPAQR